MRPPVSIVLTPSGPWSHLRACLESLRPTLGLRDEVLVVDAGTDPRRSAGLTSTSWVTVVDAPPTSGRATQRNRGADRAAHDRLVLLDGDTLVTAHWLDGLVGPLQDEQVVATGPRTNYAQGLQSLGTVPYGEGRSGEVSRFARERRQAWRARTTATPLLEGFAVAVRRKDLLDVGGLDERFDLIAHEDADLSLRLTRDGRRLLVCEDVFVHRDGWAEDGGDPDWLARRRAGRERLLVEHGDRAAVVPTTSLLSACMIVKDEAERLPACLASLDGLVDEIVVYDTGSTDETVALARAAGAIVLEGFWDDDFGRARNAALAACSAQWVLHVDADEVVKGDPDEIRADLASRTAADVLAVPIDNLDDGGGVGRTHEAARAFRRLRGHWEGRLHEQVRARAGAALRQPEAPTSWRLVHVGYTTAVMDSRDKQDRNLRVALQDVEDTGGTDPRTIINLGRSLFGAGRYTEAVEQFARVRTLSRHPIHLRQALRHGAESLINDGRPREALDWITALRQHTSSSTIPDYLAGVAHLGLGETDAALACFEGLEEIADEDQALSRDILVARRGLALLAAGRFADATAALLRAVRSTGDALLWAPLVEASWRADGRMQAVAAAVEEEHLLTVLGRALAVSPEAGDALAEQLWQRWPDDPRLLAFASRRASSLALPRALEWSARLRAAGITPCPLLVRAEDTRLDPVERLKAAAVGFEVFADPAARPALTRAAGSVHPTRFLEALTAVDELSPRLLSGLVTGAVTTEDRGRAMADVLRSLGADEQAEAVLASAAG